MGILHTYLLTILNYSNFLQTNLEHPLSPERPILQAGKNSRRLTAQLFVSSLRFNLSLSSLVTSPSFIVLMFRVSDFGDTNVSPTFTHPHLRHRVLLGALLPSSPNRFGLGSVPPLV